MKKNSDFDQWLHTKNDDGKSGLDFIRDICHDAVMELLRDGEQIDAQQFISHVRQKILTICPANFVSNIENLPHIPGVCPKRNLFQMLSILGLNTGGLVQKFDIKTLR